MVLTVKTFRQNRDRAADVRGAPVNTAHQHPLPSQKSSSFETYPPTNYNVALFPNFLTGQQVLPVNGWRGKGWTYVSI
jgi:hypothetical protein